MTNSETEIRSMISKAAQAHSADEAMRLSQAALNAAHALQTLREYTTQGGK